MAEKQHGQEPTGSENNGVVFGYGQATEALEKLRNVIDQANQSIKDLTQVSEDWAQQAQGRAREVAKGLAAQSDWTTGKIPHVVGQNPLASLAAAFALGFLAARLIKR